jgi:hypothetical protein
MPSPYIAQTERTRQTEVGFEQVESGTLAEVVSAVARTDRQPWRADFRGASLDTTEDWQQPVVGVGGGASVVSGALNITSGVAPNSVTYVRSKRAFHIPVRTQISFTLSQRIVNQTFYVELVNDAGTAFARWKFDGTNNTIGKIEVGTSATAQTLDASVNISATSAAQVVEIDVAIDEANFRRRVVDSNAAAVEMGTRTNNLPHPDDVLYLQIRSVNGATAPASTTTLAIQYIIIQDVNELAVEVVGGRGGSSASSSVPVQVVSTINAASNSSNWAVAFPYTETTTPPGASATVTGTARDVLATTTGVRTSVSSYPKEVRVSVASNQTGVLYLEVSNDNVTWYKIKSATPVGGANLVSYAEIIHSPTHRYIRSSFTAGATAPTSFTLNTLLVAA